MSTDWNIRCVDCNAIERFNDANHEEELMLFLIKHRYAIAAIAPLFMDQDVTPHFRYGCPIELTTGFGRIDPMFFAKHAGHKLVPHNEYGHDLECPWPDTPCTCQNLDKSRQ